MISMLHRVKCLLVDDLEETGWAAAMLNVRPAVRGYRTHIKAVAGGDELLFEVAESFVAGPEGGEALILRAGVVLFLQALGGGREHRPGELASHGGLIR